MLAYFRKMTKKFQKRRENFTCLNCQKKNYGNGYTNHCNNCLWSRHVDINPGDRAEKCRGLMKPIYLEQVHGDYCLTHKCQICGKEKKNRLTSIDNFETAINIVNFKNKGKWRKRVD